MPRKSEQSYSHLAESYNRKRFEGANGRFNFESDRRIILDAVSIAKPTKIIDVPVGTGRVLEYLNDVPVEVIGVDFTQEMLDVAKNVASGNYHKLQQGSAAELPFDDNEFDLLISLRFFHLFTKSDRAQFSSEFCRVVKPGGYALVSFTNGWYSGGVNWAKKRLGMRSVHFEHFGEVGSLFPGWRVHQIRGNFLPKQWLLDPVPLLGPVLRSGIATWPLNRVCWEKFYLLQNPAK